MFNFLQQSEAFYLKQKRVYCIRRCSTPQFYDTYPHLRSWKLGKIFLNSVPILPEYVNFQEILWCARHRRFNMHKCRPLAIHCRDSEVKHIYQGSRVKKGLKFTKKATSLRLKSCDLAVFCPPRSQHFRTSSALACLSSMGFIDRFIYKFSWHSPFKKEFVYAQSQLK